MVDLLKKHGQGTHAFGLGQTNLADKFCGIWDIFGLTFLQKKRLNIHIPNIHLGLGFEFGLPRIRNLVIMCP